MSRPNRVNHAFELIGHTPVVRFNRVVPEGSGTVFVKLESANPGGNLKDRIALAMIQNAEQRGVLQPGMRILEATSSNTGIGLAFSPGRVLGTSLEASYPSPRMGPASSFLETQRSGSSNPFREVRPSPFGGCCLANAS